MKVNKANKVKMPYIKVSVRETCKVESDAGDCQEGLGRESVYVVVNVGSLGELKSLRRQKKRVKVKEKKSSHTQFYYADGKYYASIFVEGYDDFEEGEVLESEETDLVQLGKGYISIKEPTVQTLLALKRNGSFLLEPEAPMVVFIKFGGFYESIHMYHIEKEISCSVGVDDYIDKYNESPDYIDFKPVLNEYGLKWVEDFKEALEKEEIYPLVLNMKFLGVSSPREYNYRTDEIIVSISLADIIKAHKWIQEDKALEGIKKNLWDKMLEHTTTSAPGYIPFFAKQDYDKKIEKWEKAQFYLIFNVLALYFNEHYLANAQESGALSSLEEADKIAEMLDD